MILDNEEQRNNLLQVIRNVTVSGTMEEAVQIISMLKGLEYAVQGAGLQGPNEISVDQEEGAKGTIHAI